MLFLIPCGNLSGLICFKRKTAGRDAPAVDGIQEPMDKGKPYPYQSPAGGALNTSWVDDKMDFIFSCLLS
ncbi:MAG: hypothetical protein QM730_24220 [Anaerolineales bacterium]